MTPLLDSFKVPDAPKAGLKLVIGIVHGTEVDGWFFHSMIHLLATLMDSAPKDRPIPISEVLCVRSGPALQLGRGVLVNTFMEKTDGDVLLMLDSDMRFTPQTIFQMWKLHESLTQHNGENAKILGGLAFIASAPRLDAFGLIQPNIWAPAPDGSRRYAAIFDYPQDTLIQVGATGAACLMVHREVFEKIAANQGTNGRWFYHEHLEDGDELGEDLSFCRRATDAGYPIFMHTALKFGHAKPLIVDEVDYLALKSQLPEGTEIHVEETP